MCAASVFASDLQLSDLIDRVRVLFVEVNNRLHGPVSVGLVAILIAGSMLLLQTMARHAGDYDGDDVDDGHRCYPSTSLDKLHDH